MTSLRPLALLALLPLTACLEDGKSDADGSDDAHSDFELELHDLVNDHRESIGLDPLTLEAAYSSTARAHSTDMADGSVAFGHDGFEGRADEMADTSPELLAVGENVAWISSGWDAPAE